VINCIALVGIGMASGRFYHQALLVLVRWKAVWSPYSRGWMRMRMYMDYKMVTISMAIEVCIDRP